MFHLLPVLVVLLASESAANSTNGDWTLESSRPRVLSWVREWDEDLGLDPDSPRFLTSALVAFAIPREYTWFLPSMELVAGAGGTYSHVLLQFGDSFIHIAVRSVILGHDRRFTHPDLVDPEFESNLVMLSRINEVRRYNVDHPGLASTIREVAKDLSDDAEQHGQVDEVDDGLDYWIRWDLDGEVHSAAFLGFACEPRELAGLFEFLLLLGGTSVAELYETYETVDPVDCD